MKLAAAPMWVAIYAIPAVPLVGGWMEAGKHRSVEHRLWYSLLIGSTISFLWLYSGCFTQALLGPSYSGLREAFLCLNFFGVLIIGLLCFFSKPQIQWFTAFSSLLTAFLWALTIAANSVA